MDESTRAGQVSRREVLKKGLVGAAGLTVLPAVLAACSSSAATAAAPSGNVSGNLTGTLKIGSNHSDPSEATGMTAINAAFTAAVRRALGAEPETDDLRRFLGPGRGAMAQAVARKLSILARLTTPATDYLWP